MLCVQVFADDSFCATTSSSPRRTISTMDDLRAEMERAKAGFARAEAAARARTSAAAQAPQIREVVKKVRTQAAEAKTENLTRLRSASAAAAAPAPAQRQPSPGVALLRRKMAAVKGQPNLLGAFEEIIKAAEKQRKRAARHGGSSAAECLEHQVFGGPSGTGKSSSVKVLAEVLASPEVALLQNSSVVTLNKDTDLSKAKGATQPQKIRSFFEKAVGGILFLDEVHNRQSDFAKALLTPLEDFRGKVMVIIAGYGDKVRKWLRDADPGLPSRFNDRVEFLPLSTDTLVEIGEDRLVDPKQYPSPFSLDSSDSLDSLDSARAVFRRVMAHVSARTEPCAEPLNARGAKIAVDAMIRKHEARDDLDDLDMCITTKDILDACPFAASPPPAATASQHAPTAAHEGHDRTTSGVSTSTADAPAAASDSEDSPLSERARMPSKSAAPAPAASRKRKAESGDARQRSCSPETTIVLAAIDAHYVHEEGGTAIAVMDFLRQLLPNLTGTVKSEVVDAQRASKGLRETLQKAIEILKERGVNTTMYQDSNSKWLVSGFALLPPRAAVQ